MAKGVDGGRSGAEDVAAAKRRWARGLVKGFVAVSVFIVFSGLIVYAYNKGKEAGGGGTPPIIKAGPAPYKVRPDRPGGMQVLNRDKQIYSRIDRGPKPPVVERLLPPAETPMAPTAAAPVPLPAPPLAAPRSPAKPATPGPDPTARAVKPGVPATKASIATRKPPAAATATGATRPANQAAAATARRLSKITPASGGGYKIQLASLRSNVAVARSWKRLVESNKDLLGGLRLTITRRDLGSGKGVYFRMQAGPLPDAVAALDLCARLKRRKLGCLVIRP